MICSLWRSLEVAGFAHMLLGKVVRGNLVIMYLEWNEEGCILYLTARMKFCLNMLKRSNINWYLFQNLSNHVWCSDVFHLLKFENISLHKF